MDYHRIAVVGVTGSGKTTLARQLASYLNIPHVELDALYWQANWEPASKEIFRSRVADALKHEQWVVDGNYREVRDIVWGQADTLIWLDYSLPLVLWRLLRRTSGRVFRRETLWNGNRESLWKQASKDSIFLWALKSYRRLRQQLPPVINSPEYAHLQFIHLCSPLETRIWLAETGTCIQAPSGMPLQ